MGVSAQQGKALEELTFYLSLLLDGIRTVGLAVSGQDGAERKPLHHARSLSAADRASGDPDPQLSPKLREETEASQVMAETVERSLEAVALPPPQLAQEGGAPHDPAGCGHAPQIRGGADRGCVATTAGQEEAPPPTEGLEAASASVATDSSLENGCQRRESGGEKALEACGAEKSGSEVMAEARAEEAKTEKCSVFSGAGDEEVVQKGGAEEEDGGRQAMEVEERPVGEETEMVEETRAAAEVRGEAGPPPLGVGLRMNPLEAIQLELDTVNAQADRAFQQLEQKFGRMRRHYLERRNYIIQNIPGFWVTAFRNHPQLSPLIRGRDAEMLRYVTNLEVKELRHPRTGCKFKFFFRRNPYFLNKLIVKEYEVRASGRVVSLSTPIIWRQGREPQSFIRRNQDVVCSFFTWFSDHSLPESDRIAEIIKEDLWPNPLQYYLLREGARRPRRRRIREPVEIPRPFGFQSG
ncbi:testis-specific Y-encoded-like protein 1 [Diceros bicornis minor]|uniref:testis-specific Y-encoded-like protein 1 n=1 Tax=Diceros bicornis minor TaxID=77932 RepID=UPI0026EC08F7|nr:testis-specific Y-encoded-like protein 1 [Diceros bicornis minor]